MKTKKVLFTTAGIIKLVISGAVILLFGLVLLLSGTLKDSFLNNYDIVETMVKELIAEDASYAYLETMEHTQVIDIIFEPVITLSIFMLVMGVTGVVFGIFNILFSKNYDKLLLNNVKNKIIYTICLIIFNWGIVTNVLSLVSVWLKDERKVEGVQS